MTIPQKLNPGDKVAITATSSPVNEAKLIAGIKILESMGLKPYTLDSCHKTHDYLAGTDSIRLKDLHTAFKDKHTKAVFAARGGYGAARLLPHIDYNLIKNNPKIFVGFSDVTALHIVFNQICKLVTFHGPMPGANLNEETSPITLESLRQAIFGRDGEGDKGTVLLSRRIIETEEPSPCLHPCLHCLLNIHDLPYLSNTQKHKNLTAPITGGNLSIVAASLGTPYEIKTRGRILFLEEIDEAPYRVDRLFLQLKQAKKFSDAEGIILGDFSPETTKTLETAINELILTESKPLICNFPCGHTSPTLTLPLGKMVSFESLQQVAGNL